MKRGNMQWLAAGLLALGLAGNAGAGEMQYAFRIGGSMLKVDSDRVRDGEGSSTNGFAMGLSLGYRTDAGLLVELGLLGSGNVDSELLSGIVHQSLGVGWQFEREGWRRARIAELINQLNQLVKLKRWRLAASTTAIQPLIVGANDEALAASEALARAGLLVPAIRPPTVPRGTARLRISLSAAHAPADVEQLATALNSLQ